MSLSLFSLRMSSIAGQKSKRNVIKHNVATTKKLLPCFKM